MMTYDSDTMNTQVARERIPGREESKWKSPELIRILIKPNTNFFLAW